MFSRRLPREQIHVGVHHDLHNRNGRVSALRRPDAAGRRPYRKPLCLRRRYHDSGQNRALRANERADTFAPERKHFIQL